MPHFSLPDAFIDSAAHALFDVIEGNTFRRHPEFAPAGWKDPEINPTDEYLADKKACQLLLGNPCLF